MARKVECDRCKTVYDSMAWTGQEMDLSGGYSKELCGHCVKQLKSWIEDHKTPVPR
jgi:hypothetical protein